MMISVFDKIENIVGKEENSGYEHLLLFHNVSKGLFLRFDESLDCVVRGGDNNNMHTYQYSFPA